jgi:hypothetical protein
VTHHLLALLERIATNVVKLERSIPLCSWPFAPARGA